MKQKFLFSTLSVILLLSLLSCIAEVKYPSVESVSISPDEITTLEIRQSQKFTATVHGENNPPKSVTWGVTGNNSSTTIIDSNGLLSVALDETSGTLIVNAASSFDPSKIGEASVNVVIGVGGKITFGAYQWRVLDIQDDMALILCENIILLHEYHISNVSITWTDCSLRAYLNGEFYNSNAFSNEDRSRIVEVTNINENNQWFGTNGGPDTQDKIFLLSIAEVVQYFGDSGQLANRPSGASWIDDQYNSNRIATFYGVVTSWYLRSPGIFTYDAVNVGGDVDGEGFIYMVGTHVYRSSGVRPALWLDISSMK